MIFAQTNCFIKRECGVVVRAADFRNDVLGSILICAVIFLVVIFHSPNLKNNMARKRTIFFDILLVNFNLKVYQKNYKANGRTGGPRQGQFFKISFKLKFTSKISKNIASFLVMLFIKISTVKSYILKLKNIVNFLATLFLKFLLRILVIHRNNVLTIMKYLTWFLSLTSVSTTLIVVRSLPMFLRK